MKNPVTEKNILSFRLFERKSVTEWANDIRQKIQFYNKITLFFQEQKTRKTNIEPKYHGQMTQADLRLDEWQEK